MQHSIGDASFGEMKAPSITTMSIAVCLGLWGLIALTFGHSATFDFISLDDPNWVSDNPVVQKGLTLDGLRHAFSTATVGHWAPLTVLSHMAVWQWFGNNAGAHHLANVVLHGVGATLLFLALLSLTKSLWKCAAVAAFFAVHPLRVESIMWVTERKDVLCGVFFFGTLWAYATWARRGGILRYLVILALATCALMSKSMAVTLPCVLLLLDYWPLRRIHRGEVMARLVEKLPLFALSIAASVLQYWLVPLISVSELGWIERFGNAIVSYAIYVGQLFWPAKLSVFYPHPGASPAGQVALSLLVVFALTVLLIWWGRRLGSLTVGWLWFLGMLVPVIGLIQPGDLARADRYTYLPQIGLLIVVVWGGAGLLQNLKHRHLLAGSVAILSLAAAIVCARAQASVWKDEETLWSHALASNSENWRAHQSLGVVEGKKKNYSTAIGHFREAVRLNPSDWRPQRNLTLALIASGDVDGALVAAESAVRLNPENLAMEFGRIFATAGRREAAERFLRQALVVYPENVEVELELASAFSQVGALDEAERLYRSVLARNPGREKALLGLTQLLSKRGGAEEAIALLGEALQMTPENPMVLFEMAHARLAQGQVPEALNLYRKILEKEPDMVNTLAGLAWQLATAADDSIRSGPEAVRLARRAVELGGGNDPTILAILGAAYAEAGQFPEALSVVQQAIERARQTGDSKMAMRLQSQRDSYQRNLPLRTASRAAKR